MQPFGCLPNMCAARDSTRPSCAGWAGAKVVSVDLDASLPRLLVYNRVKLLLEGEG